MRLTNKQKAWCQEYLVDLNATQAAIRAGYSERSAKQQGTENLAKPPLMERVQELMDKRNIRCNLDSDHVRRESEDLYQMAKAAVMENYSNASMTVALKALELVGKHSKVQAYKDRVELGVSSTLIDKLNTAQARVVRLGVIRTE
jgi:phage terminase small subunit